MKYPGIETDVKKLPEPDAGFIPLYRFNKAFLKTTAETASGLIK